MFSYNNAKLTTTLVYAINYLLNLQATRRACKKLNIHMSRSTDAVARDMLLAFIMLSVDFSPINLADILKYWWDFWFSV